MPASIVISKQALDVARLSSSRYDEVATAHVSNPAVERQS